MSGKVQRVLYSAAVLCWAGVLLYFYASGRISKYLAPDFRVLTLLGGLGLGVMGLFTLLTTNRQTDCGHDHGDGGGCDQHEHGSDLNPWFVLVVMVIPLGLAVAATRDGFSQAALARKGLYDAMPTSNSLFFAEDLPPLTREQVEELHAKDAGGYHQFNLLELFFATGDRELQGIVDGMKVATEGRVVDELEGKSPTRKRLYRLFITCCAADSRAIPIVLEFGGEAPEFDSNSWLVVQGTMRFPLEEGRVMPVIEVETAEPGLAPVEESFTRGGF